MSDNCCICGKPLKNKFGNNPEPFKKSGRCCDKCNTEFVIPARLSDLTIINNEKVKLIKELRDLTGTGMIECKTALFQNNWNIDQAYSWIRKHGLC